MNSYIGTNLSYRGIVSGINVTFERGLLYGILGPNGSGKTTLLRLLSRIYPPCKGEIKWNDQVLQTFSRQGLSRIISLVPQQPQAHFDFTVYDLVSMGRFAHGSRHLDYVDRAIEMVGIQEIASQLSSTLSSGERQLTYIARSIASDAPIILLDEPIANLDVHHQMMVWQILKQLVNQGKIVITTVHDLLAAKEYVDFLYLIDKGKIYKEGSAEQVLTPETLKTVFKLKRVEFLDKVTIS